MKNIIATVLAALLSCLTANMAVSANLASEESTLTIADSDNIKDYREIVSNIESDMGAYAPDLPEKLLSLGLALQRQGRHGEALGVFKRGTHLARINNGLYTAAQIPLIQGEITSHIAQGELQEADERQHYMHKVQQRSLASPESRTQAMMQQASWQYSAFQLGIGEQRYDRLLNMWDLYRGALTDIADREGDASVNLLSPLNGLLQTQYLIAGYEEKNSNSSDVDSTFGARQQRNRFNAYRAQSYKQGRAVIRAIYDVEKSQTDDQYLAAAEALIMLGDWMQWHGDKEPAQHAYLEAQKELAEHDDAEQLLEQFFGAPVPLPTIESVPQLPPVVAAQEGDILLEFTVTEQGRVTQLKRLDENEEFEGKANRLMRKLRITPFRPRFEDKMPVSTENIANAYKISE